jgi:hypothetical protein
VAGWERHLTPEDVRTAHRLYGVHQPLDERAAKVICAHAGHRVHPIGWPCRERTWAARVLAAAERGEVSAADTGSGPATSPATGATSAYGRGSG